MPNKPTVMPTFLEKSYGFWSLIAAIDLALFTLLIMPWGTETLTELSGGVGFYDALFSYSPALFYAMAEQYMHAGREFYVLFSVIADTLYPITYGLFFYFLITWLVFRVQWQNTIWRYTYLIPLATVLFDLIENALLVFLLTEFPREVPTVVQIASTVTSIKWLLVTGLFLTALIFASVLIRNRRA